MFLNYFALGVLIFVFLVIFYGIIAIHDIPYLIAKKRNHPHADAIHTAGWVSLFTLHVIWPFLSQEKATDPEIAALSDRISRLEHQLAAEKKTDYSTFPEI
ncbi:GTPase [Klebsiella pneumoniae]|nr:GTPase [Klebsiella pneumoniae]